MATSRTTPTWISRPRPNPGATLRLFCFHYSGGSAHAFRGWPDRLPAAVELLPAHLPGHGSRIGEAPFVRLEPLVQALADALAPHLERPFALLGHSMGALVAFELARELRWRRAPGPAHLFAASHPAPQTPPREPPIHGLPEAEFVRDLRRFDGTPQAALENAELMGLLLPLLRADFAVCETYAYAPAPPLDCPISAYGGTGDARVTRDDVRAWREQTSAAFASAMFPGGHFFLHTAEAQFLGRLAQELEGVVRAVSGRDGP